MTATRVRELLHAVPFKPFRIHLPGNKKIRVPHPDFISLSPSGRTAAVFGLKDEMHIVDIFLVTALETEAVKNGKTTK